MDKYQDYTDEQLLAKYRQEGEEVIVEYLLNKYKPIVRKKARTLFLLGGENEDLIQEGMIGLVKAIRDYDESVGSSFGTFASICVSRQIYTAIESAGRKKHMPLNNYVSIYEENSSQNNEPIPPLIDTMESEKDNNPESLYFGKIFTEGFWTQLKKRLSTLEEQVLLPYLSGVDYIDIAEMLDKKPKTVDNAIQRCKQKAEKLLQEDI